MKPCSQNTLKEAVQGDGRRGVLDAAEKGNRGLKCKAWRCHRRAWVYLSFKEACSLGQVRAVSARVGIIFPSAQNREWRT